MTRKQFDLSKYVGGIERNSTGHIVGAEATTLLFGLKFNPELNAKEGRLVGYFTFLLLPLSGERYLPCDKVTCLGHNTTQLPRY